MSKLLTGTKERVKTTKDRKQQQPLIILATPVNRGGVGKFDSTGGLVDAA